MMNIEVPAVMAVVGILSFFVGLVVHTGLLFRWGGGVQQMLQDLKARDEGHDREIMRLREANHQTTQILTRATVALEMLEKTHAFAADNARLVEVLDRLAERLEASRA